MSILLRFFKITTCLSRPRHPLALAGAPRRWSWNDLLRVHCDAPRLCFIALRQSNRQHTQPKLRLHLVFVHGAGQFDHSRELSVAALTTMPRGTIPRRFLPFATNRK